MLYCANCHRLEERDELTKIDDHGYLCPSCAEKV